jgi:hypothetical protein
VTRSRSIPGLAPKKKPAQDTTIMTAQKLDVQPEPEKRRLIANVALAAVWVYVAMIWLLALDQMFHWGIF